VIARGFHAWERRLASVDTNRIVRPFDWGLEWIELEPPDDRPLSTVSEWSRRTTIESERFFDAPPTSDYELAGGVLRFPSVLTTPHADNNLVRVRIFPAQSGNGTRPRKAVVVLPQWNSNAEGHVGLCRLLARFGLTAARLSLPYHDERRPPELERADYIVSSNIGRTLQANRQAVVDAKRTIDWLVSQGFDRIGVLGTSLGSCLSMLTMAHDPRVRTGAFNHISPFFADVVWRGLSTRHVRRGMEGHLTLDELRACWMPISPWPFIDRVCGRQILLVYARYDLTFPVDLSREFIAEFERRKIPHHAAILPCGHYTTGKAPFKYLDGYYLTRFLVERL
jgi:dienelactone hydrolase